jgi:uncharacterized repeat protein (TIGR03803 family)
MTETGGRSAVGTVFAVNTDGTGFRVLHAFTAINHGTNSDGANTQAQISTPIGNPRLVLSGNTLYGTTESGGSSGRGTLFSINTDGNSFTVLHNFTGGNDGSQSSALVISPGNTIYGTARGGGSFGWGTVFEINTNGTGFAVLHNFTAHSGRTPNFPFYGTNSDGVLPNSLILSGNTLYGTAWAGGSSGYGTIFSISLPVSPPQLTITRAGSNLVLAWPTNATVFTLQSTTHLGSSAVWNTNSPAPAVVNGQNTVTNSISGTQKFFRLSQ